MKNKKPSQEPMMGEFIVPLVEGMSFLLIKSLELIGSGMDWFVNTYLFKRNQSESVKKIERKDLNNKKQTILDDAIGYSVTRRRNILGTELNRAAHTAVIGASGSGKTVLLDNLMYEDMKQGNPVVFIDPKGDNESLINFINLCKWTGREFYIFSDYWNGEGSCELNPVKDGSSTNIADRIHRAFTWSEEHYAQICRDAVEDAVDALQKNDEQVTIENIYNKLLDLSDSNKKDASTYDRNEIQGILSRLKKIMRSDFGPKLKGTSSMSFKDIRDHKKCVYIGLSVLGFAEIARSLGKVILGDIAFSAYSTYKTILPEEQQKIGKIAIYIDELSAVITDEFIEILNKVRGAKMELTFAFQSPSDIAKHDADLCVQVLENTANWFVFKQRIKSGAQMFSDSIGTMEAKKQTIRVEDGEEQTQGSQRVVEELIVHSNIIKNLNVGQCVLLRHYPTRIDLINLKYIDPKILQENVKAIKKEVLIEKNSMPVLAKNEVVTLKTSRPLNNGRS